MMNLKNLWLVAHNTFLQLYKGKTMIAAIIMSLAVLCLSFIATEISYGVAARVSLDFGLGASSLCSMGLAIFLGLSLITKEIEQRTLFMILTRPISRGAFLMGKALGVAAMMIISIVLLMFSSLMAFKFYGGSIDQAILFAYGFIFLEALIVLFIVLNLSLVSNPNISLICGILITILGHTLSASFQFSMVQKYPSLEKLLKVSSFLLPDLDKINLRPYMLYPEALIHWPYLHNFLYSFFYIAALSLSAIFIFKRKEIH